jgi:predicted nuclease of predicted toxin-antitoxin system
MLFLADEDFPGIAVSWLRETGHDVLWARTSMPGQSDTSLLAAAQRESRIVLTCDKDFGELAFHWGLPATCGIVLFRLPPLSPKSFLERVMLPWLPQMTSASSERSVSWRRGVCEPVR